MKQRIRLVAVILLLCIAANLSTFPVSAKYFSDIYPGMLDREFFDAFNYVSDNGYIAGTDSTHFSPYESITRAMFVAILYRYADTTETYSNSFTDVPTNAYYYDAVGWAVHYGIVAGTSTTTFSPDTTITKEQMAAFLYRYAKNYDGKTYTPSTFASITAHPDYSYVSSYAIEAIRWAKTYHVFPLVNNSDYISPTANMNRAYAALFLANYAKNVTGFQYEDRFHFNNTDSSFSTTFNISSDMMDRLNYCIDTYYGENTLKAYFLKSKVQNKIGVSFDGACFGMTFSTYFDKLGKIDFNKNIYDGASNMGLVGTPKYNTDTVESAINYYQVLQYVDEFADASPTYSIISGELGEGISDLYNYVHTYGAVPIGYYYEDAVTAEDYGHAVIVVDMIRHDSRNYTICSIDPNNYGRIKEDSIVFTTTAITWNGLTLTKLKIRSAQAQHILDNFDLDGTYNTMTYPYNSTVLVNNDSDFTSEVSAKNVNNDGELQQKAVLVFQSMNCKITNASGEEIFYNNGDLSGNMEIYEIDDIENGSGMPTELILTVDVSDYYIYENLSTAHASFCAITADSFGSVYGSGIEKVTVNTSQKTVDVEGSNMDYRVWLDIGIEGYERFWLKGENEGNFSVFATSKGVGTRGVYGTQESGFANKNTLLPTVNQLSFSEISTFEWVGNAQNRSIVFSGDAGIENLTALFFATNGE